jgi:polyisoprenoid-binding protein YceI
MKARQIVLRILGAWLLVVMAIAASAQRSDSPADGSPANQTSGKKITIVLDPAQTEIHWTLGATLHTVHGTFKLKGGTIVFDPQSGAAQGEIVVCLETGESGSGARDSRMQEEVLESAQYPQAVFRPKKIIGTIQPGAIQNVTVVGTFRIHGADHPLNLNLQVQMNGETAIASTRFAVPYVQWGMKDLSTFVLHVEKEVNVEVTTKGNAE